MTKLSENMMVWAGNNHKLTLVISHHFIINLKNDICMYICFSAYGKTELQEQRL